MIINETTENYLNRKTRSGQKIYRTDNNNKLIAITIIGVVKNFNYESLRQNIGPLCFMLGKGGADLFRLK